MLSHLIPRSFTNNFKQLTRQLYKSIKLMNSNDSSSSDSSSSNSDSDLKSNLVQHKHSIKKNIRNKTKQNNFPFSLNQGNSKRIMQEKETTFSLEKNLQEAAEAIEKAVDGADTNIKLDLLTNIRSKQLVRSPFKHHSKTSSFKPQIQSNMDFIQHLKTRRSDRKIFDYNMKAKNFIQNLPKIEENTSLPKLSTWKMIEEQKMKLYSFLIPTNFFQEQIQLTKEGKVWNFPINNEQGMDEEEKVHFSDHIFLERHLRDWCPKTGPLRHFMELVCVGLSKNAFMTVEEKIGHISWYRLYFEDKKEILEKLKNFDEIDNSASKNVKRIEASI